MQPTATDISTQCSQALRRRAGDKDKKQTRATRCNVIVAPSGGKPSNINEIYTSLKSTFSGLQFCCRQYGSISIRLGVIAFQMYEIA